MIYEVLGTDENIDIRGEIRHPGDRVELSAEDAAELVERGVLRLVEGESATGQVAAPAGDATAPEAPAPQVDAAPESAPTDTVAPSAPAEEVAGSVGGATAPSAPVGENSPAPEAQ